MFHITLLQRGYNSSPTNIREGDVKQIPNYRDIFANPQPLSNNQPSTIISQISWRWNVRSLLAEPRYFVTINSCAFWSPYHINSWILMVSFPLYHHSGSLKMESIIPDVAIADIYWNISHDWCWNITLDVTPTSWMCGIDHPTLIHYHQTCWK